MEDKREAIIRQAILCKLGNGLDLFTADDLLTVAGITEEQLEEISGSITAKSKQKPKGKRTKGAIHE